MGSIYALIDDFKSDLARTAAKEDVSELLIWMLLRQVSDFELLKIKESEGLLEEVCDEVCGKAG